VCLKPKPANSHRERWTARRRDNRPPGEANVVRRGARSRVTAVTVRVTSNESAFDRQLLWSDIGRLLITCSRPAPSTSIRFSISVADASIEGITMTTSAPASKYRRNWSRTSDSVPATVSSETIRSEIAATAPCGFPAEQVVRPVRGVPKVVRIHLFVVPHRHLLCEEIPYSPFSAVRVGVDCGRDPRRHDHVIRLSAGRLRTLANVRDGGRKR